eukprot:15644-Eustigmatos_ZCMA.PRE.1
MRPPSVLAIVPSWSWLGRQLIRLWCSVCMLVKPGPSTTRAFARRKELSDRRCPGGSCSESGGAHVRIDAQSLELGRVDVLQGATAPLQ